MAQPAQARAPISQLTHEKLRKYTESIMLTLSSGFNLRSMLLMRDRAYAREQDYTAQNKQAQNANRNNDPTKIQNPTIPIVAPQVETGVAFFTDLFLSGYPIFPVIAEPDKMDQAQQIETAMANHGSFFNWGKNLAMCFRDGFKHNLLAAEVTWKQQKTWTILNKPTQDLTLGVPTETVFEGNSIKRLDLYNILLDTRVQPNEIHTKGEYAGYTELMSRIQLMQLFLELDPTKTMNKKEAFESGTAKYILANDGSAAYYVPVVNPTALVSNMAFPELNWLNWAGLENNSNQINYSDMYEVTTMYARIVPSEMAIFKDDSPRVPHIYKWVIVNRKVVIFLERQTNAHNYLPIVVGQLVDDGLGYQTKSFADQAIPYQQISTALWNSAIQSQRRKVYDRIFYDPSRIAKKDIDNVDPVARVPVSQQAYGKPITEAFAKVEYTDNGIAELLQIASMMGDMADVATGQNRVQRGQFQKGNKTRYEVNEVMNNSDARPRMAAVLLEMSWLQPIKHMLKTNILQFQPPATMFNQKTEQMVKVDPVDIRTTTWEFKIADGVLPADKIVNLELFGQAFQYASAVPAIGAEYDLLGMFTYQLQLQGATWVSKFKRTPDQINQTMARIQQSNAPANVPAGGSPAQGA